MDFLNDMLSLDKSSSIAPLLVIGRTGTSLTGDTDDLATLVGLCVTHYPDLWLHIEGYIFV